MNKFLLKPSSPLRYDGLEEDASKGEVGGDQGGNKAKTLEMS